MNSKVHSVSPRDERVIQRNRLYVSGSAATPHANLSGTTRVLPFAIAEVAELALETAAKKTKEKLKGSDMMGGCEQQG